jgi:flavin reductase (DIM6/NTAB) family NADH-FMN oxidoreductase RutF/UTP-glucose-1-phosphate uridylyltransferase
VDDFLFHGLRTGLNGHKESSGVPSIDTRTVILAGGRGARLAPFTSVLPKPLMPVGERAILELVVEQLERCGIHDVTLCVGYLSHLIRAVLDNRENGPATIRYVQEQDALGTAGPLRLVEGLDDTFIVMNGDILTTLDYADLLHHHREHGNALTIATRDRKIKIDYGVLRLGGLQVEGYVEKPEIVSTVSMGIYVLEPWVLDYIPEEGPFDFPDLIHALLDDDRRLGAYQYDGLWFDIGRKEDYEEAVATWIDQGRFQDTEVGGRANGNGAAPHNGNGYVTREDLRETMSRVPRAVTVVTAMNHGRPHATTVSAFSSLSAEPPLVMLALNQHSDLLRVLEPGTRFAVNLLASGQEAIGLACAEKGTDKLAGISWREIDGVPWIDGAAGWISCEVMDLLPGGDHQIVVGIVTGCISAEDAPPLMYHRRSFLDVAP